MRVLAFAAEPWETKLVFGILNNSETFGKATRRRLALSDNFSFQFAPRFVDSLREGHQLEVSTLEERFISWQQPGPPPSKGDLQSWLDQRSSGQTAVSLIASDIILDPYEYSDYVLPIGELWRDYIAQDICDWTEEQFNEVDPSVVICVERRRLAHCAAQVIADYRGIPMVSMIMTRVGNRWMARRDLGMGMSSSELDRLRNFSPQPEEVLASAALAQSVRSGHPLYAAPAYTAATAVRPRNARSKLASLARPMSAARTAAARHIHGGRKTQTHKAVHRYGPSYWGTSRREIRSQTVTALTAIGALRPFDWDLGSPGSTRFVLWLMHVRPESSTSALGRGVDELEEIIQFRRRMPGDIQLVAKENPLMIGHRDRGTYGRLRKAGIRLCDPKEDTGALMRRADGIVSLSGTALLEAAIRGVPTLALGQPEFLPCLTATSDNEGAFIRTVQDPRHKNSPPIDPLRYLAWVLSESSPEDLPFLADLEGPAGLQMIRSFASRLWRLAHD